MTLLDSSAWLEILKLGPNHETYLEKLRESSEVLVPTTVVYEVAKVLRRDSSAEKADVAASLLQRYQIMAMDTPIALVAARLTVEQGLSMADAVIYATAMQCEARLVTGDAHLGGLPGVEYIGRTEG